MVEDTNANLRSENIKLQESFTSLQAIHKALEVEHNTTLESYSKASEKSSSSIPSKVMVVHVVIMFIFKLVLLTMLR